ncbi:alpha/beta hydrolase [Mucilaginibacter sp. E4BP6]|uniref:alpha/beta hydrolase n=1 Tax=Mucilaginibacter sp. E4BP6 TaxID=2723089 RepID=UPI0015CEB072|nr:alpha/beta hydrolase [Mucilaginibacter sp. E4BP6]NYE66446.1 pimeloyl-ACP methyl ester carboxylesterase [Mucilaginibacter sp. E4BP6]
MSKVFLISGLGADTRLYNNIDIPEDDEVVPVDWIEPHETDTLDNYAQKIIYQYDIRQNSVVIGTSLGGMLTIEIAKKVNIKKAILISSIKTIKEAPGYFSIFKALPIYKLLPLMLLNKPGFLIKPMFGHLKDSDAWLFNDMLSKGSPKFMKWAMGAVLNWSNITIPPNVHHIHGDKDCVFPVKNIKDATIVKGGSHIMIFDKAKQVNKWLKPILNK